MGVPKKRKSHSKTRMHRNHQALSRLSLSTCPRCGSAKKPHTVCDTCGTYKQRTIVDVEAEAE